MDPARCPVPRPGYQLNASQTLSEIRSPQQERVFGTNRVAHLVLAKCVHLRTSTPPAPSPRRRRPSFSAVAGAPKCLLAARSAVTCNSVWLSLAWRSSRRRRRPRR